MYRAAHRTFQSKVNGFRKCYPQVNKTHLLGTRCVENNDAHLSAFKNDRTKLGRKLNFSVDKTWRYLWVALKLLEAAVAGANERNKKEEDKVRKMKGKSLRTS